MLKDSASCGFLFLWVVEISRYSPRGKGFKQVEVVGL
jgi:hypothetical protein